MPKQVSHLPDELPSANGRLAYSMGSEGQAAYFVRPLHDKIYLIARQGRPPTQVCSPPSKLVAFGDRGHRGSRGCGSHYRRSHRCSHACSISQGGWSNVVRGVPERRLHEEPRAHLLQESDAKPHLPARATG